MRGLSKLELEEKKGLVHLYVGEGKGKTTAAVGLAVRMLGQGGRVLFCQFLKGRATGEVISLEALGAEILRAKSGVKFLGQMNREEREDMARSHRDCLAECGERVAAGNHQLLVLDEVVDAVNCGLVEREELLELLTRRPEGLEVVLTGRNPTEEIIQVADYHTNFSCVAHPYQHGVVARRGIEY